MPRVPRALLIPLLAVLTLTFDFGVGARALPDPPPRVVDPWSLPTVAGGHALGDPQLAFTGHGDGAIAWSLLGGGGRALSLGAPGSPAGALRAAAGPPGPRALPLASVGAATSDGRGRVVLAGQLAGRATATLEADPSGPFGGPVAIDPGTGPVALTNYLTGEVALADTASRGGTTRVLLRLQPPRAAGLGPPALLSAGSGPVGAIAVGLDYGGDALVAWQQDGLIFARERRKSGTLGPLQRLGISGAGPRLGALISDDGRGIVAWTDEIAGPLRTTIASTHLSISRPGVRFAHTTLVQAWVEPPGTRLGNGAMRLLRLSDGRVVLGWTAGQGSAIVARVAPVTLAGLHPAVTVSEAGTDAQLDDLAAGTRGEVLAVFTAGSPGGGGEIESAVGIDDGDGQGSFAPAEPVAAVAAPSGVTAAFEPVGDRPVIVWRAGAAVEYAVRTAATLP